MDLHYEVIIDTQQAEEATNDIEALFDQMGKSADKSIRDIAGFGGTLVEDMRKGGLSAKEATDSIEALRYEIQRMAKAGKFAGKDSKQFAGQANMELQKLLRSIKQIEREKRNDHKNEMSRLRAEEREKERARRAERREQVTRKRAIVWQNRALRKAGATEISGGIGWILGATKFGGIGGISTVLAGAVSLITRYKDELTEIYKMGAGFLDSMWYYFDYIIGGLKGLWENMKNWSWTNPLDTASNFAKEKSLNNYIKERDKEREETEAFVSALTDLNKTAKERKEAWDAIVKMPAFKDVLANTNENFERYTDPRDKNAQNQLQEMIKSYYKKETERKLGELYTTYDLDEEYSKITFKEMAIANSQLEKLKIERDRLTREEELIKRHPDLKELDEKRVEARKNQSNTVEMNGISWSEDALRKEYYRLVYKYAKEDAEAIDADIKEARKSHLGKLWQDFTSYFRKDETKAKKLEETGFVPYEHLSEEGERQKERLANEERRKQWLEDQKKAEEERKKAEELRKKREQFLKQIRSMARKDTAPEDISDYEKALWEVEDKRKDSLAKLQELNKFHDAEFQKAYQDAHDTIEENARKKIRFINDEFDKTFRDTLQAYKDEFNDNKWDLARNRLESKYQKQTEESDRRYGRYSDKGKALRTQIQLNKEIEKENLLTEKSLENIEAWADEQQHRLDLEREGMSDKEYEQKNKNYELDLKRIDAEILANKVRLHTLELQQNLSTEEKERIKRLKQEIELLERRKGAIQENAKEQEKARRQADWGQIGGSIGGSMQGSSNGYISGAGNAISGIGQGYQDAKDRNKEGESANAQDYAQAASQLIDFAITAYDGIEASKERCKETLDEWNKVLESSAHKMAMLNIEQWEYRQKNMFGVEDPYDRLRSYLKQGEEAQKATAEAIDNLGREGRVQVGWGTEHEAKTIAEYVGTGAGTGAGVGSIFGPWGTLIGAVVGAIGGAVTGYFASEDLVPIYNSLRGQYGDNLYDPETLEISKEILADYEEMDDATKNMIDNVQELLDKQKEVRDQWRDYIKELVGDLGNGFSDVLYDAFTGGRMQDAVGDMRSYMEQQLSSLLQREVFGKIYEKQFSALEEQLSGGLIDQNGNLVGDVAETMASFLPAMEDGLRQYNALMEEVRAKYKEYGYDIFSGENQATQDALTGGISAMTEDTASKLNGNFFGLKLTTMEISDSVTSIRSMFSDVSQMANHSLSALREIAENTSFCQRLDSISNDISYIKNNGINVR